MLTGIFRVDSIKKAARREAWYHNNDGETKTYNIFGRMNARPRRVRDEESSPLHHVNTENDAQSPVEARRNESYQNDREGFEGPHKSSTFPEGPKGNRGYMPTEEKIEEPTSSEESKDSNEKTNTGLIDQSVGPQNPENKARKRKSRKFWKKEEGEGPDLARQGTEGTQDSKKNDQPKPTFWSQVKAVFGSWINILLVFVPVGIAVEYAGVNKVAVFIINFLAIIPLAAILSYGTEELALYIGEVLGGLLNASFGNAVELIVSIIALTQHKILIVQTSLVGSMLSNLLLVLGMCFFLGGLRRTEQFFNVTVAQTAASLLALAIGSLIIPTAFQKFAKEDSGVAPTSRGTSVLLLVTYGCYLLFQLRTHVDMYNEPSQKAPKKPRGKKSPGEAFKAMATAGASSSAAAAGGGINQEQLVQEEEDEEEVPSLTKIGALVTLAGSTVLVALCAEYMVSAIDAVADDVSEEFIGLILLPIVGNAAEHATAVTVAIKDKMDLSIGVAVGSSLQIALLVLPLMVMLNWWGVGKADGVEPMTLGFDGFQVVVLFIAIIVVNYLIQVYFFSPGNSRVEC